MKIPTLSQNHDATLRKLDRIVEIFILIGTLSLTCLVCCSCGTTRQVTQIVEHTSIDTVYLSNVQYDSIYIYKDHVSEHHLGKMDPVTNLEKDILIPIRTDTLYIKDVSVEYRYKLLRDTVRIVERDSIPYEVVRIETKQITRPLTWYDHLTRLTFWLVIGALVAWVILKIKHLKPGQQVL